MNQKITKIKVLNLESTGGLTPVLFRYTIASLDFRWVSGRRRSITIKINPFELCDWQITSKSGMPLKQLTQLLPLVEDLGGTVAIFLEFS